MGRPREEPPPGSPAYKKRKWDKDAAARTATISELRTDHPWWWLCCRNPACGRMVPIAVVPLIIRLGLAFPIEELRRNARCNDCGHRGATLSMRSYADLVTGYAPWPKHFITDARGIAVEPNRPTHYHGGRPMEWWLRKQRQLTST